jgi:hypothetical protein
MHACTIKSYHARFFWVKAREEGSGKTYPEKQEKPISCQHNFKPFIIFAKQA